MTVENTRGLVAKLGADELSEAVHEAARLYARQTSERVRAWAEAVDWRSLWTCGSKVLCAGRPGAAVGGHDLTWAPAGEGWEAVCACGWRSWPCLSAVEAGECASAHAASPELGPWASDYDDEDD